MVMVSINCITYNHEKYIAQAIEGFLSQRTNFEVEILIHDDASTDRTADIIREYVQKYPETFNVIYQTENQYSKGVFIGRLNEGDVERDVKRHEEFIRFINLFDAYTDGKYHQELELSRISFEVGLHRLKGEYDALRSTRYDAYLNRFVGIDRIRPYLMIKQPHLTEWLMRIRNRAFA